MGLRGMQSLRRKVRRGEQRLDDKVNNAIEREAGRTVAQMKGRVVENNTVHTTELFRKIGYTQLETGTTVIYSRAPHSAYVEFGTGAKQRPRAGIPQFPAPDYSGELVGALINWVQTKPYFEGDRSNPYQTANRIALSISGVADNSAGGTDPHPFFLPVWFEKEDDFRRAVKFAVETTF
jgi:hypothetical protein